MTPKHQRTTDLFQLVELLLAKDEEMKELLKLAEEQEKIEDTMDKLRSQVRDNLNSNSDPVNLSLIHFLFLFVD